MYTKILHTGIKKIVAHTACRSVVLNNSLPSTFSGVGAGSVSVHEITLSKRALLALLGAISL